MRLPHGPRRNGSRHFAPVAQDEEVAQQIEDTQSIRVAVPDTQIAQWHRDSFSSTRRYPTTTTRLSPKERFRSQVQHVLSQESLHQEQGHQLASSIRASEASNETLVEPGQKSGSAGGYQAVSKDEYAELDVADYLGYGGYYGPTGYLAPVLQEEYEEPPKVEAPEVQVKAVAFNEPAPPPRTDDFDEESGFADAYGHLCTSYKGSQGFVEEQIPQKRYNYKPFPLRPWYTLVFVVVVLALIGLTEYAARTLPNGDTTSANNFFRPQEKLALESEGLARVVRSLGLRKDLYGRWVVDPERRAEAEASQSSGGAGTEGPASTPTPAAESGTGDNSGSPNQGNGSDGNGSGDNAVSTPGNGQQSQTPASPIVPDPSPEPSNGNGNESGNGNGNGTGGNGNGAGSQPTPTSESAVVSSPSSDNTPSSTTPTNNPPASVTPTSATQVSSPPVNTSPATSPPVNSPPPAEPTTQDATITSPVATPTPTSTTTAPTTSLVEPTSITTVVEPTTTQNPPPGQGAPPPSSSARPSQHTQDPPVPTPTQPPPQTATETTTTPTPTSTTQPTDTPTIPSIGLPITLPSITLPTITLPTITLPSITLPSITLPSITLPSATLPSINLPPFTPTGIPPGPTSSITTPPAPTTETTQIQPLPSTNPPAPTRPPVGGGPGPQPTPTPSPTSTDGPLIPLPPIFSGSSPSEISTSTTAKPQPTEPGLSLTLVFPPGGDTTTSTTIIPEPTDQPNPSTSISTPTANNPTSPPTNGPPGQTQQPPTPPQNSATPPVSTPPVVGSPTISIATTFTQTTQGSGLPGVIIPIPSGQGTSTETPVQPGTGTTISPVPGSVGPSQPPLNTPPNSSPSNPMGTNDPLSPSTAQPSAGSTTQQSPSLNNPALGPSSPAQTPSGNSIPILTLTRTEPPSPTATENPVSSDDGPRESPTSTQQTIHMGGQFAGGTIGTYTYTQTNSQGFPTHTVPFQGLFVPLTIISTDSNGVPTGTATVDQIIAPVSSTLTDAQGLATKTELVYVIPTTITLTNPQGVVTGLTTSGVTNTPVVTTLTGENGVPTKTLTYYAPVVVTSAVTVAFPLGTQVTAAPQQKEAIETVTEGSYFIGLVIPTLVATLLSVAVRLLDHHARLYFPFHALTLYKGAPTVDSMCYPVTGLGGFIAGFKMVKRGHGVLAITGTMVITSAFLIILSGGALHIVRTGRDCSLVSPDRCGAEIAVYPILARVLIAMLSLLLFGALVSGWMLLRWCTGVLENPWSIHHMLGVSSNQDIRTLLLRLREKDGRITTTEAATALGPGPFVLDHWQENASLKYGILIGIHDVTTQPLRKEGKTGGMIGRRYRLQAKGNTVPFSILNLTGRFLFLLYLCVLLVGVLSYNIVGGGELAAGTAGSDGQVYLAFLFVAAGVLVAFCWNAIFHAVAFMSPYKVLCRKNVHADDILHMTPPTNVFSAMRSGLSRDRRDLFLFFVSLASLISEFMPILLLNIPFGMVKTTIVHLVFTWTTVCILIGMIFVLASSFIMHWPHLPIDPSTIVGALYYAPDPGVIALSSATGLLQEKKSLNS